MIVEHAPGLDDVAADAQLSPLDPNAIAAADADLQRRNAFLRKALAEDWSIDLRTGTPEATALRTAWRCMLGGNDANADEAWRFFVGHLEVEMGRTGSHLRLTDAPGPKAAA